jgi:MFS family permease
VPGPLDDQALVLTLPNALRRLTRDGWLLFATRFVRLFAYGSLSVVLVFYLIGVGLSEPQTGVLLTLTLVGDTVVSLYLTTRADRIGRRRMLVVGAVLMAAAGVVFASTHTLWLLVLAGTIGVISPSGNEVGPFLAIEQGIADNDDTVAVERCLSSVQKDLRQDATRK